MKYILFFCTALSLLSYAFSQKKYTNLSARINQYIEPFVQNKQFSGSILLAYKSQIIYQKSFGYANIEHEKKNSENTKYHIASVSKFITAAAVMILVDQGKINLQDPIDKYFSELWSGKAIKIHHLLTHTSGIPNINNQPWYDSLAMFPQTATSIVNAIKEKPLEFISGTKYRYSNTNYNVLALLIEKVSGMPYNMFLQKLIFDPLQMKNTKVYENMQDIIPHLSEGYEPDGSFGLKKSNYLNWTAKTGNGSVVSTVTDLYKFCIAMRTHQLISEEGRHLMFKNHVDNTGYGIFVSPFLGKKRRYINGRSPGVSSFLADFPDEELTVIVLGNNYIPLATPIANDIISMFFGGNPTLKNPREHYPHAQLLDSLVGSYQFDKKFFIPDFVIKVYRQNGKLVSSMGELLWNKNLSFILRPYWEIMEFIKDESGNITGLSYNGGIAHRTK